MTALLEELAGAIDRPDENARAAARERLSHLAAREGSLGRMEDIAVWLAGAHGVTPPRPLDTVRAVLFAGDHGIAAAGVSSGPAGGTVDRLRAVLAGAAPVNMFCRLTGTELHAADISVDVDAGELPSEVSRHRVRRSSGRLDREDALTFEEAELGLRAGIAIADAEVDSGADLLVCADLAVASATPAAVLIGLLTRNDASVVTGRGHGIDDATWMRKCAAVRDGMRRGRPLMSDQLQLLATTGGADLAAMTGFLLQAAARRTPVVLDSVVSAACALVAQRVAFRAADWWLAGQVSQEPAHAIALKRLSLEPVLDLGVALGQGSAALLAVPVIRAAAAALSELTSEPVPDASDSSDEA